MLTCASGVSDCALLLTLWSCVTGIVLWILVPLLRRILDNKYKSQGFVTVITS